MSKTPQQPSYAAQQTRAAFASAAHATKKQPIHAYNKELKEKPIEGNSIEEMFAKMDRHMLAQFQIISWDECVPNMACRFKQMLGRGIRLQMTQSETQRDHLLSHIFTGIKK